jgi:putative MATE family efflux protein
MVNICLDIFFVAGLGLDVAGAALATILAQYCSWLFSILYLKKNYPDLEYSVLPRGIDRDTLDSIIRVGLPLGLNNSIYSIGHVLQQSLINAQGSDYIAGCSIATKITGIANVAIGSFSSAATTFAGQNLGARDYVRLKKGGTTIPFWSGALSFVSCILFTLLCRPVLALFTKDAAVLDLAVLYTRVVLPSTWTFAVFNCIIAYANGMGEVKYPTIVNLLMLWAVRIPCGYLINRFFNGLYVMACFPISYYFGMCCMLAFFFSPRWKKVKQKAAMPSENT